jgi:hypothetical protein
MIPTGRESERSHPGGGCGSDPGPRRTSSYASGYGQVLRTWTPGRMRPWMPESLLFSQSFEFLRSVQTAPPSTHPCDLGQQGRGTTAWRPPQNLYNRDRLVPPGVNKTSLEVECSILRVSRGVAISLFGWCVAPRVRRRQAGGQTAADTVAEMPGVALRSMISHTVKVDSL